MAIVKSSRAFVLSSSLLKMQISPRKRVLYLPALARFLKWPVSWKLRRHCASRHQAGRHRTVTWTYDNIIVNMVSTL